MVSNPIPFSREGLQAEAQPAWEFNAIGHCTACSLAEWACDRVDAGIKAGSLSPVMRVPACGHVMIYRSLFAWRQVVRPMKAMAQHVMAQQGLEDDLIALRAENWRLRVLLSTARG